jgi:exodeoxyribonuclease-5
MENSTLQSNFYTKVIEFLKHEPSEEQKQLISELILFTLNKVENQVFILKGYAGTGKTTILGAFTQALNAFKVKTRLLSPTGRAAKVLTKKSNLPAYTIHKQIYRRKSIGDDFNHLSLNLNLHTNTLFIIDESSMISEYATSNDGNVSSRNLLDDVLNYVFTGKNCKLIFLGDEGQLPPVGSDSSPALDKIHLATNYFSLHIHEFCLNQIYRQSKKSGILYNATRLRDKKVKIPFLNATNFEDVVRLSWEEFQDSLESSYSNVGIDDTLVITRSNVQANRYNNEIRSRILWFEEILSSGDLLMVVKNNYYWVNEQTSMGFIANGELLKVKRLKKIEQLYGFDFARIDVQFVDYEDINELEVLVMLESLHCEGPSLNRTRIKELFFAIEQDYLYEKNKKKRYELILKNPYFNALQVKYGYAVTCHKSQGGQWSHVYIDQGYLNNDSMDQNYFRWLYTAVTRASSKVFFINFNEDVFENHP